MLDGKLTTEISTTLKFSISCMLVVLLYELPAELEHL